MLDNRPLLRPALSLTAALALLAAFPAAGQNAEPLRMSARAFDSRLEIEVRDLPRSKADAALRAAIREVLALEDLFDPEGEAEGGLGKLNAAAGGRVLPVDPRLRYVLSRAWDICVWSHGAHGPLGGRLYQLWGLRGSARGIPAPEDLVPAAESASCELLAFGTEGAGAALAAGSRLDLWGFAEGYAVDRAAEILLDHGATNAWIEIGRIRRALGGGPSGTGWQVALPVLEGFSQPLDEIRLEDKALAYLRYDDHPLRIAGDLHIPYVDQRTGRPTQGIEGTIVVTELAFDAQAVAAAMMISKNREGLMRVGALQPSPAVIWLLGDGSGTPLIAEHHWSRLKPR